VTSEALNEPSTTPAIAYGAADDDAVRAAFVAEINAPWWYRWLYNNAENEFKTRATGYYVGYALAKRYYTAADDKKPSSETSSSWTTATGPP